MQPHTHIEPEFKDSDPTDVGADGASLRPKEPVPFEVRMVLGLLRLLREQGVAVTSIPSDGFMLNDWAYLTRRLVSKTGWTPAEIDARVGVREGVTSKVLGLRPGNGPPVADKPIAHVIAEAECRGKYESAVVFPVADGSSVRVKDRNLSEEFIGDSLMYLGRAIKAGGVLPALSRAIKAVSIRSR
jgi:hypothetical protein